MLARLFCANIAGFELTFGLWILLVLAVIPAAWLARRHAPAVWTLGGTFLFWAHFYFYPLLERIEKNDPWWLFPTALVMVLLLVGLGLLAERVAQKKTKDWSDWIGGYGGAWLALIAVLALTGVADITTLIRTRADEFLRYPAASGVAVALVLLAVLSRMAFTCLTGFLLLVVISVIVMARLAGQDVGKAPTFIAYTILGVALTIVFDRLFHFWAGRLFRFTLVFGELARGSLVLVALVTAILLLLVHAAPWTARQYETLGVGGVAVVLLGLGIGLQSSLYRRFGLGVFIFALARLYVLDLSRLETFYKIIAFIALGAALIVVSFLYARFKDQFQKWV